MNQIIGFIVFFLLSGLVFADAAAPSQSNRTNTINPFDEGVFNLNPKPTGTSRSESGRYYGAPSDLNDRTKGMIMSGCQAAQAESMDAFRNCVSDRTTEEVKKLDDQRENGFKNAQDPTKRSINDALK